jgi:chitodextrinase
VSAAAALRQPSRYLAQVLATAALVLVVSAPAAARVDGTSARPLPRELWGLSATPPGLRAFDSPLSARLRAAGINALVVPSGEMSGVIRWRVRRIAGQHRLSVVQPTRPAVSSVPAALRLSALPGLVAVNVPSPRGVPRLLGSRRARIVAVVPLRGGFDRRAWRSAVLAARVDPLLDLAVRPVGRKRSGIDAYLRLLAPAGDDGARPSAPSRLVVERQATGTLGIAWRAATDDVAVEGYAIYRDGVLVGVSSDPSATLTKLGCGSTHKIEVEAVDRTGKRSPKARLTASTSACAPGTGEPRDPAAEATAGEGGSGKGRGGKDGGSGGGGGGGSSGGGSSSGGTGGGSTGGAPAPVGLVAGYSFDEGSGVTVADASGNGNVGTVSSATWSSAGHFGGALSFNGTSSLVTVPDSGSLDLTGAMTLSAWVRPSALGGWRTVLLKEDIGGVTSGQPYALYAETNSSKPLAMAFTTGEVRAFGPAQLPLSTWTHLAATYDGSQLRLYVNGALAGTQPMTGAMPASSGALRIGGNSIWGEYFAGAIDDVRLYSRALSASEIQADMTAPVAQTASQPDSSPPTAPAGLGASGQTTVSVTVSWSASSDNVGVAGYGLYVNGTSIGSTAGTSYVFVGLTCGTSYTLSVDAYDAAGNRSAKTALTGTTSACGAPPPPAVGTVYLSPNGSDANACTLVAPCVTLQRGFDASSAGGTVELAGGTYPSQSVTGDKGDPDVVFRPAGATVSFSGRVTLQNAKHMTFSNLGFSRTDQYRDLEFHSCNVDITLVNATGRRFQMFEGNRDITFQGGDWGGYDTAGMTLDNAIGTRGAAGPTVTCPGDGAPRPTQNVLFDGVTWHDVFWGKAPAEWGGAHPDCFEINGFVDGLTIRNSTFIRCGDSFFGLYGDQGNVVNVTVENNLFQDLGNYTWFGMQWASVGKPYKCGSLVFRNNTWRPNNPGALRPYSPIRTECEPPPGYGPVQITGNSFQNGPVDTDCVRFLTVPYNTVWQGNEFTLGLPCGTL